VVVVVLDSSSSASRICDRSWIYTAISRAKSRCYLVGDKATADKFCRVQSVARRKTFLAELVLREQAARSLETL
jgi:ATP-dependent exoDNAse (exonuclease V) alpha subunit